MVQTLPFDYAHCLQLSFLARDSMQTGVRSTRISLAQVWRNITIFFPPFIPGRYAFFEFGDMFEICHLIVVVDAQDSS
jgi:hypothetical protein